jgi:flagellar biosynthesis chaperone FliJ
MNEQEQYKLIKSIENKQSIEHELEKISQLVNELEENLKERGII